jgi:large subunit ribosomal protein L24
MQRIKSGDTVEVISGSDKGERGEVLSVFPKQDKVIVSQINVGKKHQRAVQAGRQQINPGIIEFEAPLYLSNVMLVCTQCDQRTRVGFRVTDGVKVRYCKKCNADID